MNRHAGLWALLLFLSSPLTLAQGRETCVPFGPEELPLERNYKILQSKNELEKESARFYASDRRLMARAYWDQNARTMVIPYNGSLIAVPDSFFAGLARHMSQALKNKYADAVIYPDMGHAHLLLPNPEWESIKSSTDQTSLRIQMLLNSKNLKALYHTAEMLQIKEGDFAKGPLPQDPWKLWRYFSRNILGAFDAFSSLEILWAGPQALYNTVRDIPDMPQVTTMYFSSNKQGCFPYTSPEGEKYFDVTFETIPYEKP